MKVLQRNQKKIIMKTRGWQNQKQKNIKDTFLSINREMYCDCESKTESFILQQNFLTFNYEKWKNSF